MKSKDLILSISFFSQTGIGVLGNSFLIGIFFMYLSGHRMRPKDAIVTQLALANCLVLLSKGIPQTMVALDMINLLDDIGCKIVVYLHRVARELSLSMTCLLSGFQAITINPSNSSWAEFKDRAPEYLIPASLFCWTFHVLFCIFIPWGIRGPRHTRNRTEVQYNRYCSHIIPSKLQASLLTTILSIPDVLCLELMVSASGYMVFLLYRHYKLVQKIHITSLSPRVSPETRATKTILLLVSSFVFSYSINCILTAYMAFVKPSPWLLHTSAFLTSCFPTVSPYVLISSDSQVPRSCYPLCGRKCSHFDPDNRSICSARDKVQKIPVRGKESSRQIRTESDPKY